mgnify:CR=1 FL=1
MNFNKQINNSKFDGKSKVKLINTASLILASLPLMSANVLAEEVNKNNSNAFIDFRLRYESVEQDNALKEAKGLTLRTLLHYQTQSFNGLSAVVEFEDSREVLGVYDYNDTNGHNTGYSVIADPNTTELDQGFIQYKSAGVTAKLGRQVITFDGHRFVGHVGWRQDKQTFDGASVNYRADKFTANYAYLNKRNRIFAENKDIDSKDHLFNASYHLAIGKLTGYGYLLEVDQNTSNAIDTFGISFDGKAHLLAKDINYRVEYASQTSESSMAEFDADYLNIEAGLALGKVKLKVGLESLGSDNGQHGFATPLATLHKFNGWSDQFLNTPKVGLDDLYLSASTKLLGGSVVLALHDFSANDNSPTVEDLGSEINLQYTTKFAKYFNGGVKFAAYSAGDDGAGKVDTDKVWLWIGARF